MHTLYITYVLCQKSRILKGYPILSSSVPEHHLYMYTRKMTIVYIVYVCIVFGHKTHNKSNYSLAFAYILRTYVHTVYPWIKAPGGIYFFPSILAPAFKQVGSLIETRHLFWKGWSNPTFIRFNTCFNCFQFINCVIWLSLSKPEAKFSTAILARALFTWILNVAVGTPCLKDELAMIYQHRIDVYCWEEI